MTWGSHHRGLWITTAGSGAASVRALQKALEGDDRHRQTDGHTIRPLPYNNGTFLTPSYSLRLNQAFILSSVLQGELHGPG